MVNIIKKKFKFFFWDYRPRQRGVQGQYVQCRHPLLPAQLPPIPGETHLPTGAGQNRPLRRQGPTSV